MLEIACFNASSAIKAARAGASRIELCADYAAGGVTPPLSSIQTFRAAFPNHPVNVMIRPRAGDFVYTDEEFSKMKASIEEFKPFASGFVFGILNGDSQVDISRNRELVELAGLSCTFHRAFDQIENKDKAAKDVVGCGFTSVLTSGGGKDATSGVDVVADLFEKYGDRVAFIAGGGVRSSNVEELKRKTGVEWYHSAAITSPGEEVDEGEVVLLRKVLAKSTSSF